MAVTGDALSAATSDALERLDAYVVARGYAGPDPYDGLASPLGRVVRGRRPRQAVVQAFKRAPSSVRRMARLPDLPMTKTLALCASGLARAQYLPDAERRRQSLTDEIVRRQLRGAWGYEFDVQTRWGFYPAGTPNVIVTAFAVEALSDSEGTGDWTSGVQRWLTGEMLHSAGCFRYVPRNDTLVHNANVLAARALMRVGGDPQVVRAAVDATVSAQRDDGTWPYGEGRDLGWVDNFHTAYVLVALADLLPLCPTADVALQRGLDAWLSRCFDAGGHPRYYIDQSGPVDIHNIGTAVFSLARLRSLDRRCGVLLPEALRYAIHFQRADGAFVTRSGGIPFMRWNQAHMHLALAEASRR